MDNRQLLSKKIAYPLFALAGFLFVLICIAEHDLAESGNILWNFAYTSKLLIISIFAGGILGAAICFAVYFICAGGPAKFRKQSDHYEKTRKPEALNFEFSYRFGEKQVMLCSFVLSVLSWFPAYLAYYPGICAYDTPVQLGQVMDGYMIDHHPIAHTLLLKLAIYIGQALWESVNAGMGLYTFFQLAFLAFGFAYAVGTIRKYNNSFVCLCIVQFCVMFYPFNAYMSVSTTKDTVFTGFFLIMMSAFMRLLLEGRDTFGIKCTDVVFFISMMGSILFRNNCKYAIMVLLPFMLITAVVSCKRKKNGRLFIRLFLNVVLSFIVGSIALTAIFNLTDAQQGDRREMLSMPIQQFARCMLYHGGVGMLPEDDGTMDEESKGLINDFLLDEGYREYEPGFADPVKRHTNTYVARYRSGDFIGTYLKLLGNYPGDFINAALALDAGYLYPGDESHAYVNEEEGHRGRGYIQTYWSESDLTPRGLTKDSKFEGLHKLMEDWADRNAYLDILLLKYIFVPGTFLWLFVLLSGILLIKKKYRLLLPIMMAFGYYATLLLGPTVQLRYIFPLMAVLPFMALLSFVKGKDFL